MWDNKRVMILPSPPNSGSVGSVTKCIGIARLLEKRGVEVCFVMGGQLGDFILEKGYKVYYYPVPIQKGTQQEINSTVDFIEWTGMADKDFIKASIEAELEAIEDFKPDVIFAEARPSTSISAKIAQIPTVMIASWSCHPQHPANKKHKNRHVSNFNEQLTRYNLPEVKNITELLFMRADVKIAPTLPELEPEMQGVEGIEYVGYILDLEYDKTDLPYWYDDWVELPQIFIYLSVSALLPDLYIDVIIDTFKDMPFRVICGCGYHYNLESIPEGLENIKFVRYISTAAIMKDTDLVIFHGGQDTTLTTLCHGVPSITIPGQHFERDYNATILQELGASKKLSVYGFRPNRLKKVVQEVLEGTYADRSRELQNKLKTYGGTKQCVERLMSLACKQ